MHSDRTTLICQTRVERIYQRPSYCGNNMANYARDKEYILKQLAMAKETLTKLRALTDSRNSVDSRLNEQNGSSSPGTESVNGFHDDFKHESDERSSGVGMESPRFDFYTQNTNLVSDKSHVARDSLVRVLGLQVSKLEDDLKVALLEYVEQMEVQKEELISSFETMHAQLSRHHEICQEHYRETAEKDTCIERLKVDKHTLELEVEKLRGENMHLKATGGHARENGYKLSPGFVEHDELSETLMKENSRLRERLRKYETSDYARMERKVALQEKLCESYNKDVMSKDSSLKRLKAENRGLHEDVKNLQDEVLRVNANRLNAEQDRARLQQELQFSEEQVSTLREKLSSATEQTRYLQRCINDGNSKPNTSTGNLPELEKEILALRGKCESYKDKLNDKERFLASVTAENQGLKTAVDTMKRQLAAVRGEERSLKIENERLQKENADREIDRLSSETTTEAHSNKISKMKQELHDLERKVGELELQRQKHEQRETELSQDMMANLEKYTRVEQQLYLSKKELTQLQGFYESSEAKKGDLQVELENSRQRIVNLERQLDESRRNDEGNERMRDAVEENKGLNEENRRLKEEFETSKTEIEELEEALQNAREQNSLQRMRLDAHDTLMKRKDERIKELQNELVVLHNQIDELTDDILKKNREMDGLRMSKRLLEQEMELSRSAGKVTAKSVYRDITAKDNSPLYPTIDPASPDSGFSDMERERAIDRLRREFLFHPQQPILYEENLETSEEAKIREDLALATRRLRETEEKLADVIAENEKLKDQEHEARSLQLQMKEELAKVIAEKNESQNREKTLTQVLEERKRVVSLVDNAQSLESSEEEESLLVIDEQPIEKFFLQPVLETIPENAEVRFQHEPVEESLIDFLDESDGLCLQTPRLDPVTEHHQTTEELERKVQDLEIRSEKLSAEKEELLSALTHTRDDQEKMEQRDNAVEEHKKEKPLNKNDEMPDKTHDYESRLAKTNAENENLLLELQQTRENFREIEKKYTDSQRNKKELQNRKDDLASKITEYELCLSKMNEENEELQMELTHTRENLAWFENEAKVLQDDNNDLVNKTKELEENIQTYETSLATMNVEHEKLLSEVTHTRENLRETENECKAEHKKRVELQKIMQEELLAKDDEVAKLQKELSVLCEEQERLQEFVDSSKETAANAEEELLKGQNIILDLEKQRNNLRSQEKSLRELLHQSEESNASLQVQLGEMEQAYRKMDKETKALQQQIILEQQGSAQLEHQVEELREKVVVEQEKQEKVSENLNDAQKQNEDLRQQLEDAEHVLENSHKEKAKTVSALQDTIREKENDIEELREELLISEQRYSEIKSLSSNNQTEISDLQAELIETKEQFFTVSQEKAKLVRDQKELEQDIVEKDEKIAALEIEKSEAKREIFMGEKQAEDLFDKLRDCESEVRKLSEENKQLKKDVEQAVHNSKELETLIAESNEERKALEQQLSAAHESITDLETAFERGEDKNLQTEKSFREAKETIAKLETQLEARQDEYRALERDYNETEKELERAQDDLDSSQSKLTNLERKLRVAEENVSELEMARDNGLSNEQLLQQRFATAREDIEKMERENDELKEKLMTVEKKLGELLLSHETLEDGNEELENVNRELLKELEYERDRRSALKQKVETKDRENDVVQRKLQVLEKSITEKDDLQNKSVEEKVKMKEELAKAKKTISELEVTKENQEESIHEIEELLRETRGRTTSLEQRLEEALRENDDLHEELEEVNRKLKYTKEENTELEKMLENQKQITDSFRNNLAEKEESVMNSNYNRDAAERSLQSMKKDLARKDAKLKMQKEQIEDMENEAEKTGRKVRETESANKKLINENDRLAKELADVKAKIVKLEATLKEKGRANSEPNVPVVRVSEVESNPIAAEKLIRDWSDKLSTAQVKVTDLENELLKDIKKHEAKVHRTRPVPRELRRRSADYVLTDHGRPSRFRSRQRPNTSRDSSVDSLRSTQSMLDYLDERIADENLLSASGPIESSTDLPMAVRSETATPLASETGTPLPSENATPVPSETSTPIAEGNGTPVFSDNESLSGVPVTTTANAKSLNTPVTTPEESIDDKEFSPKQESRQQKVVETQSNSRSEDVHYLGQSLEKILEPNVDDRQSLFLDESSQSVGKTTTPNREEDRVSRRVEQETESEMNYQRPVFAEPTEYLPNERTEVDSEPPQSNYDQSLLTEGQSNKMLLSDREEIIPDTGIQDTPEQQNTYETRSSTDGDLPENIFHLLSTNEREQNAVHVKTEEESGQQPLLIEPPPEDMFPFNTLPSSNSSSITNVTDLTFQSAGSPVFPEQMLLVTFDPLNATDSRPLDPFEQLMRDTQHRSKRVLRTDEVDDVRIDFDDSTDSLPLDFQGTEKLRTVDHETSEQTNIVDTDHVTHRTSGDSLRVFNDRGRITDNEQLPQEGRNEFGQIQANDRPTTAYSDAESHKSIEPTPPPRKMKDKLTPLLFPRRENNLNEGNESKNNKKLEGKPYSVMIMVDDEIVETPLEKDISPSDGGKKKPKRPPQPAVLQTFTNVDEEEISTSPSKIKKRLQDEVIQAPSGKKPRAADDVKVKPVRPPRPGVPVQFANTEGEEGLTSQRKVEKTLNEDETSSLGEEKTKAKPKRPPKPLVPVEFADVEEENTYKSPSQIRKELEEASKKGQRTVIGPKPTGRQQKAQVADNRAAQYQIEGKRKESTADHAQGGEQADEEEKTMGKGRLLKLIAAFNR